MTVQQEHYGLEHARIPAELNAMLNQLFQRLQRQTLEGAVREAALRTKPGTPIVVQIDEIVRVARDVMSSALDEISETFVAIEPTHVRRAS